MATIQELLDLAYQIRDAEQNGENTALRVGQFLVELVNHFNTKADVDNISGAYHLKQQHAPIMALMSVQQMQDSNGQDNKAWWSTDGHIKYQHNGRIYDLGTPAYMLYYCGDKIYKWTGSATGFKLMTDGGGGSSGGGASVFANFAVAASTNELPDNGVATTGYIVGQNLYAYVGIGGDTKGGKYQNLGELNAAGVSLTTNGDGTFTVHSGGNDYTVNLNHTHPNMAKLIVCEESDLPSTLDPATIYAITDSGETEIEKLIIHGMEFAGGGGTPSTEPRIASPIGTQIDFNGASTKTVTVRATNLSEALTIAVIGMTASLQTISANDAENGVRLTLTKGQNFNSGTLRIYSSEVDKSWTVIDSQGYQSITAIKLTGTQWLQTDYHPNANTEFELDVKFTPNTNSANANSNYFFMCCVDNAGDGKKFAVYNGIWSSSYQGQYQVMLINESSIYYGAETNANVQTAAFAETAADREAFIADHAKISYIKGSTNGTIQMIAGGVTKSRPTSLKSSRMDSAMKIGINKDNTKIYNIFDLTIYRIKITEGGSIVRDYVPRLNNGIPGLLDVAENGSGEFISSETQNELVVVQ